MFDTELSRLIDWFVWRLENAPDAIEAEGLRVALAAAESLIPEKA